MAPIVHKYGGTSVGSVERIQAVARRVAATVATGRQVVVVVSAMGKQTDLLAKLACDIVPHPSDDVALRREMDMLLSTGEQVSIALLAMALQQLDCPAISMTGAQAGILTEREYSRARIHKIVTDRIQQHLERGKVPIVAGFQGIASAMDLEITTLGRGGSDTTAVALAVALQAEACEIYTDVPGVLTTDPRRVSEAQLLPEITSDEMLELASLGARVLHPRAVELARNFGMKLVVRSSWTDEPGTVILSPPPRRRTSFASLETSQAVNAVTADRDRAKIVLLRVPDRPGVAARLFEAIAAAGINVDTILQSIHPTPPDETKGEMTNDIAFTVPRSVAAEAAEAAQTVARDLGCREVELDCEVAKISIAGAGMIGRPGIAAEMFEVLAAANINLQLISMSEIKVSCIIAADRAGDAALQLSQYFQVVPHAVADPAPSKIRNHSPVSGVALDFDQARLAILDVPDRPGYAARIFRRLADAGIAVDTISQSQRSQTNLEGAATNHIAFTIHLDRAPTAKTLLYQLSDELGCSGVAIDEDVAKVSIVGASMEAHPGTAAQLFAALASANINLEMISTSEIKVSCIVRASEGNRALQVVHSAFNLHEPHV
ncbi:aspartate kinase [Synechococcus sp. PCC 7336]|uniref:aspartate kinase n=1 Tax=Synechococcus sp. PCC 7336 TaxID=195250 RepID=UPI000571B286|nr:aspartate kinase [Synechococcus sp. PCC 7336]